MVHWLGQSARDARERSGRMQVHVAASLGVNQVTISRFEQGRSWPRDPDLLLAAYADDLDIDPREIWEAALALWRAAGDATPLQKLLEQR